MSAKLQKLLDKFIVQTKADYEPALDKLQLIFVSDRDLFLRYIRVISIKRREGIGTLIMKEIIQFADHYELNILLAPGDFEIPIENLTKWYKSFGFEDHDDGEHLVYRPKVLSHV